MNCRYCGNVYTDEDRTCGGCGAPKHALRQKVLDAPATPEHWSNSLKDTIFRLMIGTFVAILLVTVAGLVGLGGAAAVLVFFWAVLVVPVLLTYAAWRDAKGDWAGFFMRSFLIFPIWSVIFFVTFLAIGFAVSV